MPRAAPRAPDALWLTAAGALARTRARAPTDALSASLTAPAPFTSSPRPLLRPRRTHPPATLPAWHGDSVTVVGAGDPRFQNWGKGFGVKIEAAHAFVATLPPDDLCLFTDA